MFQSQKAVLTLGNRTITSSDCVVESVTISSSNDFSSVAAVGGRIVENPPGTVEINITLKARKEDFKMEWFDDGYNPKIRDKRVEDCSIRELLFAAREKLKE